MRSSTARARLDPRAPKIGDGPGLAWRSEPGQPLAHEERKRLWQRRLGAVGRFIDAASLVALLEPRGEIGRDAFHALGADGLDSRLLDRLEHRARFAALRRELGVQARIVAGDGKG